MFTLKTNRNGTQGGPDIGMPGPAYAQARHCQCQALHVSGEEDQCVVVALQTSSTVSKVCGVSGSFITRQITFQ